MQNNNVSLILTRMVPISKSMACEEFDWIIDVKMSDNLDAAYIQDRKCLLILSGYAYAIIIENSLLFYFIFCLFPMGVKHR